MTGLILPDSTLDPFTTRFQGAYLGSVRFDVPWISHITGNLYQGGSAPGLVLPEQFRTVVSMDQLSPYRVLHHGVTVHEFRMDDVPGQVDADLVRRAATVARDAMDEGPVLVHCQAGLNRSGLIAAAALVLGGHTPGSAVSVLRSRRSPAVLCNADFHRHVLTLRPPET